MPHACRACTARLAQASARRRPRHACRIRAAWAIPEAPWARRCRAWHGAPPGTARGTPLDGVPSLLRVQAHALHDGGQGVVQRGVHDSVSRLLERDLGEASREVPGDLPGDARGAVLAVRPVQVRIRAGPRPGTEAAGRERIPGRVEVLPGSL